MEPFARLLYTGSTSPASDLLQLPTRGAGVLHGRRGLYLGLRAWCERSAGIGELGTIDVLYTWGDQKGVLASRLVFRFGAHGVNGSPLHTGGTEPGVVGNGSGPFYEADRVRWGSDGLVRPVAVYRESGGGLIVFLPTLGALGISARCEALTSATVLVGGFLTDRVSMGVAAPGQVGRPDAESGTINAANGRLFSWVGQQRRVEVWNNAGGSLLYGRRGATAGSGAGDWDFLVYPESVTVLRTPMYQLALYSADALVSGTDYVVVGEEGGMMDG